MARNRFVKPQTVRLELSDGDWIEVKKELNAGEHRRVFGRLVKDMRAGERAQLDPEQVGLTKVVEYLVAWSLEDNGKPVEITEGAINSLDAQTFGEIVKAIDAHEAAVDAEIEARKNDTDGGKVSSPISPSAGL